MRMGNYMWGRPLSSYVMAATPTRPGIRHVTVVPTNFEETDVEPTDDDSN